MWATQLHSLNPILHSLRSKLSNSGRMYCNECQSWALRGILFLGLLRNMDYEWGRDQTCCGFNMYESFHLHQAYSFIYHSRWGSAGTSDTGEKQPHRLEFLTQNIYFTVQLFISTIMFLVTHKSISITSLPLLRRPKNELVLSTNYVQQTSV